MESTLDWHALFVLGPILGLLLVGLVITLRSGVVSLSTHHGVELLVCNLSQLLIRIAAFAIGLFALQRFIGAPF